MESLNALTQLNKVPLDMTIEGHNAFLRGQQADNIGLQELMRKQAFEQQMDPMRVAEQSLRNKGLTLGNEKSDYELRSLGRKDKMETELWDQTKASKLAELLDKEGEAKANVFGQRLYEKLQTTRPGTPEHKAIMGALETTKGWVEKRRDAAIAEASQRRLFEHQSRLEEERTRRAAEAASKRPDKTSILVRLRSAKTSIEKAEILEQAYWEARAANDPAAAEYGQRALEARQRAAEEARNRGLATPGIDTPAVANLPSTPAPSATAPIAGSGAKANTTKSGVKYEIVTD